jgi:hypothetical protein
VVHEREHRQNDGEGQEGEQGDQCGIRVADPGQGTERPAS